MDRTGQKELRLERFLGKKVVIFTLIGIEFIIFSLLINYLINILFDLKKLMRDLEHPEKYLGLKNCIPNIKRIENNTELFLFIYILFCVIFLFVAIRQCYRMRAAFSNKGFNLNQKGSARWTTSEEIRKQYKKIPDRDKSFSGYGGTIVSRMEKDLYIDTDLTNNLIIGITRSGKGEMFVIPSIDVYSRAEKKTSMVICDPKTELYKTSKKTLEERGYLTYLLSLADPEHSMGFNPLAEIVEVYEDGDYDNAELLAQSFCYSIFNPDKPSSGDTFWQDTPTSLLTALILAMLDDCHKQDEIEGVRKHIKKVNIYSIINNFGELVSQRNPDNPYITGLDMYFNSRPNLDRAKIKFFGIEVAGTRTKASIYASMLAKLTIFTYENVAKMTAESSLKLENIGFGEKPVAVFLEIPDYDKSTHFLASVFIRQMYFVLAKKATRTKTGKCRNRVKVIADEAGNIPAIENLENIMTVCLGRNISFDLYIQAYSQLTKLYGENAKTITGNCGNTIFILSDDDETAKRFSENLGKETIIDLQRNGERLSTKKTLMENTLEKPLLNMNQLEELRLGECVVKRVMKRTDLKGRIIKPHPIFNSVENGRRFLFRYEYLTKTFPNPDEIDLREINTESRSHINLRERVWDYRLSFALFNFPTKQQDDKKKEMYVIDLPHYETLISTMEEKIGKEITLDMEIGELENLIKYSNLKEEEKSMFLNLIENGKRK